MGLRELTKIRTNNANVLTYFSKRLDKVSCEGREMTLP